MRGRSIAGLRPRRHRPDFDKAEAEPQQRIGNRGVLVKARGNSDRIGKIAPKGADAKRRVIGSSARNRCKPQRVDRKLVRVLRIDDAQQRKRQTVKKTEHGSLLDDIKSTLRLSIRLFQVRLLPEGGNSRL